MVRSWRVVAVFMVVFLGGPGIVTTHAAPLDLPEIEQRATLRVIVTEDEYPERFSLDTATDPGFERELLEGFAKVHGLEIEVVRVDGFGETIPALLERRGDLIVGIDATPARRERLAFTSEVLPARLLVVTHSSTPEVATIHELDSRRVGLLNDTSWAKAALDAGVSKDVVVPFEDHVLLFDALESGDVTATVMSVTDFALELKTRPKLQPGAFVGPSLSAAWGVRKDDPLLKKALDAFLAVAREGTQARLAVKYFGLKAAEVFRTSRGAGEE